LFGALHAAGFLRVDEHHQEVGCDQECASPKAYNLHQQRRESQCSNASEEPFSKESQGKGSVWSATTGDSNAPSNPPTPPDSNSGDSATAAVEVKGYVPASESNSGDSVTAAVEVPGSKAEPSEVSPPPPAIPALQVPTNIFTQVQAEEKFPQPPVNPAIQVPTTTTVQVIHSSASQNEGVELIFEDGQAFSEHVRGDEFSPSGIQNQVDDVKVLTKPGCATCLCVQG